MIPIADLAPLATFPLAEVSIAVLVASIGSVVAWMAYFYR
ncbi:hypothetical protein SAMN05421858_1340 [Haladaptatus litoreus]|uniref:Uncharacterized protein n=1 Tax=Haladaptatus litoreus TaxID=553468 RepID=A0A1N6XZR8_9EURY|nr:hypothetical protein SAMN05421858_1340 [Haladaptatus litoreus]